MKTLVALKKKIISCHQSLLTGCSALSPLTRQFSDWNAAVRFSLDFQIWKAKGDLPHFHRREHLDSEMCK